MWTSGWFAYRYKGIYYREFCKSNAEPSQLGLNSARKVPRDPGELKEFKLKTIASISGRQSTHMSITDDNSWMVPARSTQWTYLIDFDNDVFTVNGTVHFKLRSMPSCEQHAGQSPGFVAHFDRDQPTPIPARYLNSVSYWDPPHFGVTVAQELYDSFKPITAPLRDWGAPTWGALSVAQDLSACLIRTLVADYSEELSLAAFRHMQRQLGLFTWQLTCIAASSNMICPPRGVAAIDNILYLRADLDDNPAGAGIRCASVSNFVQSNGFRNRFSRFRGCLVVFCIRLDEPAHMMNEVGRLSERLSDRGGGVGIAISSWQMVAIAVDDTIVRHSPVLNLHDGKKELNDGALLLMHLLRPTSISFSRSPWCRPPSAPSCAPGEASHRLPEDIVRHIVHFTDHDTFIILPKVSRLFRSIYLAQPRVGHCTLLGKYPGPNNIFKVYNEKSSSTIFATLTRVKASKNSPYNSNNYKQTQPLWKYAPKCCQREIILPSLARTFQYHQTGSGSLTEFNEAAGQTKGPLGLKFQNIITGKLLKNFRNISERSPRLPSLRIQVVDGLWEMIGVGSKKAKWLVGELSKIPDETPFSYDHDRIGEYEGEDGEEDEYELASAIACYCTTSSDD